MDFDKNEFKVAMSQFATGVTVVTTRHQEQNIGITVNAFCSVSLDPMLVLVSIAKPLYTHGQIDESGIFAVNILAESQRPWGERFAGMFPDIKDRFFDIDFFTAVTGAPVLPEVLAWVDCEVLHRYDGGDHTLFIGRVVDGGTRPGTRPLLYWNRSWGELAREGPLDFPEDAAAG